MLHSVHPVKTRDANLYPTAWTATFQRNSQKRNLNANEIPAGAPETRQHSQTEQNAP